MINIKKRSEKYKDFDYVPQDSLLTFIKLTKDPVSVKGKVVSHRRALYRCKCGNEKDLAINSVNTGCIKSCGCLLINFKTSNITHGMANTPLHAVWCRVKARCLNKNSPAYLKYGARGVKMCDEWVNSFEAFANWAINNGYKEGLHLDKDIIAIKSGLEPNLYSPERCQFVSPETNALYKRNSAIVDYKGEKRNINELAREAGLNHRTVYERVFVSGWDVEKALTTPILKRNKRQ